MTPAEALREKLEVSVFPDDLFGENCYLIRRRDTMATLVVDPGLQLDWVRQQIDSEGLTLEHILVTHGMTLAFQDLSLRILHTPGHTQGSVCFLFGLDCFAGDTLFQRGIGRTDLPGGDMQKIVFSIRNVLYALPPKTVVYPGHGPATTIEEEKLLNPFVPGG